MYIVLLLSHMHCISCHKCMHQWLCVAGYGSTKVGLLEGLVATVVRSILRVPKYVPSDERFNVLVLVSGRAGPRLRSSCRCIGQRGSY